MRFPTGQGRALWLALLVLVAGGAAWAVLARGVVDPDAVWKQGETDFLAGRYDRAEAALARLARLRAPTPLDLMLRAQFDLKDKREDEALAVLARIPNSSPIAPEARLLTGQVELRRDRARQAEQAFRAALKLNPKLVRAHKELISIYGIQLRRRLLHAEFRALSELAPITYDNIWHWCLTRNTYWEPVELRDMLSRYLKADPDDRDSRRALAECQRHLQQFDEAEATLAPLPESDPDARAIRARIALDRGDDRAAEALLAGGPDDHPELAQLRGRFALAHRKGEEALRHFRAAYAAEPDDRDTLTGMASALMMVGQQGEAEPFRIAARNQDLLGSLLQKVAAPAGRDDSKLHNQLGAACEAVGRYPEARAWYNLALEKNPLDAEAQQGLYRLEGKAGAAPAGGPG